MYFAILSCGIIPPHPAPARLLPMTVKHSTQTTNQRNIGPWTIRWGAYRAIAYRSTNGGEDMSEARTSLYLPGRGVRWSSEIPKYVSDAVVAGIRRKRREMGLPL